MSKFKVGDVVKCVKSPYKLLEGRTGKVVYIDPVTEVFLCSFEGLVGHTGFGRHDEANCWWIASENLVLDNDKKKKNAKEGIYIFREGSEVIAKDINSKKVGVSKCHPDDEFDFVFGAKLALSRLLEEMEVLNCKFVVTKSNECSLTVGKIYEVKDGRFRVGSDRSLFPTRHRLTSFDELKAYLGDASVKCKCGYFNSYSPTEIIQIVE